MSFNNKHRRKEKPIIRKERKLNTNFWASILSAIIVTIGTIYGVIINKTTEIHYVETKISEWNIENAPEYLPLKKGNYWDYSGLMKIYTDVNRYSESDVTLKMEIIEETSNGDLTLFGIKNSIEEIDLLSYYFEPKNEDHFEIETELSGYLLIANEIYYIPSADYTEAKNAIIKQQGMSEEYYDSFNLGKFEILYRMPLFKGQRFGELDQIARPDLSYFWYVNDYLERTVVKKNQIATVKDFELIKQGLSFHEIKNFTPYLGITSYKFNNYRVSLDLILGENNLMED